MRSRLHFTTVVASVVAAGLSLLAPAARAADGGLDPTFGAGGKVWSNAGGSSIDARGVALQPDGKIVVVGDLLGGGSGGVVVLRFNPDGSVDPTWRDDTTTPVFPGVIIGSSLLTAGGVAVQPDGKVVVVGTAHKPGCFGDGCVTDFGVVRFNPDGSPDSTFGTAGLVTTDFGGGTDTATAVVLEPDGRILVGGSSSTPASGEVFVLARYRPNGTPDPTFGTTGNGLSDPRTTAADIRHFSGRSNALLVRSDGQIVAAGRTADGNLAVNLYDADGNSGPIFGRDAFGLSGREEHILQSPAGDTLPSEALSIVQQPDGKVVAAGRAGTSLVLDRLNFGGFEDPSFGTGGAVVTGAALVGSAIVVQPDGRLLVGGAAAFALLPSPQVDFALLRFNPDGSPDTTFGAGGKVITDFTTNDRIAGLALRPDGRVVAAGSTSAGGGSVVLTRYLLGQGSVETTDLAVSAVASAPNPPVGATVTYTVRVTNFGPNAARDVEVTDTIPPTTAFVSTAGAACSNPAAGTAGTVVCQLPPLAAGQTVTVTVTVKAPVAGAATNTATVDYPGADTRPANNSATVSITV